MMCVVCVREGGNDEEGVITLQSTSSGMVCPTCINQLVDDVMMMRKPWPKEDMRRWGWKLGEEE